MTPEMKEKIRYEATRDLALSLMKFMAAHTGQRFRADAALLAVSIMDAVAKSGPEATGAVEVDKLTSACAEAAKSFRAGMESQIVLATGMIPFHKARG
mgnify:CR=1 FL=1|jgi:hypothetical protein